MENPYTLCSVAFAVHLSDSSPEYILCSKSPGAKNPTESGFHPCHGWSATRAIESVPKRNRSYKSGRRTQVQLLQSNGVKQTHPFRTYCFCRICTDWIDSGSAQCQRFDWSIVKTWAIPQKEPFKTYSRIPHRWFGSWRNDFPDGVEELCSATGRYHRKQNI